MKRLIDLPALPHDKKKYILKSINGTLVWVEVTE